MNILGVGPLELLVVLVIALVVVGPKDMVTWARKMGAWLRKIRQSQVWRDMMRTSWELQRWQTQLQEQIWRESGLQDITLLPPGERRWHPAPPWTASPTPPPHNPDETPPSPHQG